MNGRLMNGRPSLRPNRRCLWRGHSYELGSAESASPNRLYAISHCLEIRNESTHLLEIMAPPHMNDRSHCLFDSKETNMVPNNGLIRLKDLQQRISLSKASIYQLISQDLFPRQVKLTPSGRAVAWRTEDIDEWIQSREEAE